MLGISLRTVRRRMNEFSLSVRSSYSDIDDDELKRAVQQIKVNFPCSGYRIIDGLLRQRGICVQQLRLREVVQSIDPHGITVRLADLVQRRRYSVPGPQSLWHLDGNHKLIRYVLSYGMRLACMHNQPLITFYIGSGSMIPSVSPHNNALIPCTTGIHMASSIAQIYNTTC